MNKRNISELTLEQLISCAGICGAALEANVHDWPLFTKVYKESVKLL